MEYLFIFISYLFGSIPFGLLLTKFFIKQDIRKFGSGNIGATNVLRTGNKILAFSTLVLDILKGYIPVAISQNYFPDLIQISSLMVFLGHIFPVWLKFKGGKGVATYLGILFAISLSSSLLFVFTWIIVALIFKYSSLSSITATVTVLIINIIKDAALEAINPDFTVQYDIKILLFIFLILIIFTHRNNISNLKNNSEKKIKI